jgi:hypothetical protein
MTLCHLTSSTITLGLQILQGLLTPVIAVIAVYIAWQQYKVNERKFAFDQYERRLHVYQEVHAFLMLVIRDFKPEVSDLQKFTVVTAEADFLFKSEISDYVDKMVKRAWILLAANSRYRDFTQVPPSNYDHQKVVTEMQEQETWFTEQLTLGKVKEKFKPYLDTTK